LFDIIIKALYLQTKNKYRR